MAGGFDVTLMTQSRWEISIPLHASPATADDLKIILHMIYTYFLTATNKNQNKIINLGYRFDKNCKPNIFLNLIYVYLTLTIF